MKKRAKLLYSALLLLVPVITVSAFILFFVTEITTHQALTNLANRGDNKLQLYSTYLSGLLEKYESLPELFANDDKLVNSLLNPGSRERIDALNEYLVTINTISNTSDTYLMDRDGLTIAASNWNDERPFVGRNFSYRPYFKEAMGGQLGRYYALGTTSSRRGYYFAYPVRKKGEILGAVVVKVNIDSAERRWGDIDQEIVVTDPDGVVFISTNKNWRFHVFGQLNETARMRILKSRRYPKNTLVPLDIIPIKRYGFGEIVTVQNVNDSSSKRYLVQNMHMEHAGWDIKILSNMQGVKSQTTRALFFTLLLETVVVVLIIMFLQRQQRLKQLKKYEKETRQVLQEANEQLESRVLSRTAELTETNKLLTQEIIDRQETEEALQQTREELIHAAKLAALGQLSAGINHEMNQPLAAIRSYADNASQFLHKGRIDETRWNLEQIGELTERMGQVVAQLKLFSRKSSGQTQVVPLHGAIDGALEILNPSIRKLPLRIQVLLEPEDVKVKANNVLLQQVFVNLINNGVQAVENQESPLIKVHSFARESRVHILIEDNGTGIKDEQLPHIFEPFYTTKISGKGLGLGLTITERILTEVGGKIFVTSSSEGTVFEIILEQAE